MKPLLFSCFSINSSAATADFGPPLAVVSLPRPSTTIYEYYINEYGYIDI